MRTVGLKVLKNKLSEYVRIAAGGETVLVTDRDRVVAELRPPQGHSSLTLNPRLAGAMRQGLLSAPMVVREGPPPRVPAVPLKQIIDELHDDRNERNDRSDRDER